MHVNGSCLEGEERFGEQWGMMLQEDLPAFFAELGQAVQAEGTDFQTWYRKDPERFRKLADKYLY